MATSDLEKSAKEAFVDDNFDLAVDLYTQAIDMDPTKPDLFADRAQANIKLNNPTDAIDDANKAIALDPSMAKAYLRKGTACFKLEEYQTAKTALETGAALAPGDSRFTNLIKQCDEHIAEETGRKQPKQAVDNTPAVTSTVVSSSDEILKPLKDAETETGPDSTISKPKYRHEHYQKPEEVVVTIFAKKIPAKDVAIDFGEQILSVTIKAPEGDVYHFQPRLFGKIKPDQCRFEVLSTKIEIRLVKAEAIHWTSLEFSRGAAVPQKINVLGTEPKRPSYPSSKLKAVDWDKLEAQVKKEEKDEKLEGDAALNKFFREIYQDADEDTRRAMSKSFIVSSISIASHGHLAVESNGTVLSTNWKDVGAKVVEGTPPDGMELRKWEY
ncbi:hypothetical protein Sjap_021002 [Stephania japonica]|uniref:Protein SGT1 homolog n=1 Tax=Stephania japonica TaxID=461633 RepID=A0AAP0F941_9MAGN